MKIKIIPSRQTFIEQCRNKLCRHWFLTITGQHYAFCPKCRRLHSFEELEANRYGGGKYSKFPRP